ARMARIRRVRHRERRFARTGVYRLGCKPPLRTLLVAPRPFSARRPRLCERIGPPGAVPPALPIISDPAIRKKRVVQTRSVSTTALPLTSRRLLRGGNCALERILAARQFVVERYCRRA